MRRRCFTVAAGILLIAAQAAAQTNYDTSPNGQTGEKIFGSYFAAGIDTVGIFNGNLNLSIPLFSLPGRELPYGPHLALATLAVILCRPWTDSAFAMYMPGVPFPPVPGFVAAPAHAAPGPGAAQSRP